MKLDKIKYALLWVTIKSLAIWPYWVLHTLSSLLYPIVYYVVKYRRAEWTSDNGRGYSIMVTPSLYHSSGIVEVYDYI